MIQPVFHSMRLCFIGAEQTFVTRGPIKQMSNWGRLSIKIGSNYDNSWPKCDLFVAYLFFVVYRQTEVIYSFARAGPQKLLVELKLNRCLLEYLEACINKIAGENIRQFVVVCISQSFRKLFCFCGEFHSKVLTKSKNDSFQMNDGFQFDCFQRIQMSIKSEESLVWCCFCCEETAPQKHEWSMYLMRTG